MNVAFQTLTQKAGSALGTAELALFKAGQVLQALVVGQTGAGLTQLRIGDVLVEVRLPQPAKPGTTLQLQVKAGGSAPQLVLISQPAPVTTAEVAQVPLPGIGASLLLPEAEARPVPTAPLVQIAGQTAAPLQGAPVITPQGAPSQGLVQQAQIVLQGQVVAAAASRVKSSAPLPARVGGQSVPVAPPGVQTAPQVTVAAAPPAPPAASALPTRAQPVLAPSVPMATAVAEAVVPQPVTQPVAPEAAAANPLLLAQAAPKVQQTVADLPRVTPVPAQAAPVATAPPPGTPAQALAQMAPEVMAKQNSVGPLLQSLAAVVAQPAWLPEPIVKAALQMLAQRIVAPDGRVKAAAIETAVTRSGLFLEAALASGTPVRADAKAALLNLKAVLEKFLGAAPPSNPPARRETPPLRGLPPRATPLEAPPLPDAPRDLARALHGQTDAAISRVKLGQLAALPDAPNARPAQPELRIELPFLIGQELVMVQLEIAQDGRQQRAGRKRGWTMRFAMNFSQTGEVGAEVGLLGRAVNVALWAAEAETAAALTAALPDLARALEGLGLDPGAVRIRSGVPEAPKLASGHFVDAFT